MKNILILGGGFAGIQAAIELQKKGLFIITLISERDFLYLYPTSIWIPVHKTKFNDVKVSLNEITKKYPFQFIVDKVKEIHAANHQVIGEKQTYNYDYLIVAFGTEKMKHQGIENTLSICGKPEISLEIQNELDKLIELGHGKIAVGFGGNPNDKSAMRGGPAFELIFNIHNALRKKKKRQNFELTFFAPMEEPGAKMGKKALIMINKMFAKYKILKHYGKKIKAFEQKSVIFEDDSKLNTDLILFIPASSGHSILQHSDLPLSDAGFIKINNYCQVPGYSNVYAIGDIAAIEGPEWKAKQGHIAELMGKNAAHNILETEKGTNNFKGYLEALNIICIMDTGNGAAIVFRNNKKSVVIPLPIIGHWLKKAWGIRARWSKTGKI